MYSLSVSFGVFCGLFFLSKRKLLVSQGSLT
jgi:hypothetical protein